MTDAEWEAVFRLRCRSKRGERLSRDDQARCEAAYAVDPARYAAMNDSIFNETAPFGAKVRR